MDKLTPIFEKRGDVFIGYVKELSGANAQGSTIEEVKESLQEAIELILQANEILRESTQS